MDDVIVAVLLLIIGAVVSLISVLLAPGITGYYADKRKVELPATSSADDVVL